MKSIHEGLAVFRGSAGYRLLLTGAQPVRERTRASWLRLFQCNLTLAVLVIFSLTCLPLHSQNITADILGTVTDSTGAVVANANVTILDQGTNATRATQTNGTGEYVFSSLPVGTYSLTVQAAGFKPYKMANLTASSGGRLRVDAKLQLGAATQTVEVQASAETVQTDSSSVGETVPQATVEDMPLNGRNLTNLVTLQPGINAGLSSSITNGSRPDDRRQSSEVSANGQMDYLDDNVLDGIDNNERYYGLGGVKPSVDALQEIQVQTGNFPADIGRAAGAAMILITKSGTNQLHGSLYEFFRNDIFDAREYYTPKSSRNQEWRQNQFGGTIGGPIKKDKSFFFASIEEMRQVQGVDSPEQVVPTASDRAFVAALTNPSPQGKQVFDLYPEPISSLGSTLASGEPNLYVSAPNETQYITTVDVKYDQHFSPKDQFFARFNYNPTTSTFPGFFPACGSAGNNCNGDSADQGINPVGAGFIATGQFPGTNKTITYGGQLNYTHEFSPNLLMELRTGIFRINIDSEPADSGTNDGTKLGIPNTNIAADPRATGMPGFHFLDGSADLGDQIAYPILNTGNNFQWNGDVIYTRGTESLKMGGALIRRQVNYQQEWEPQGWIWFVGIDGNSAPVDMAEGVPPLLDFRQNMYQRMYLRSWEPSVFVQDDWRVRNWLTLNLGLRYDVYTPFSEAHNQFSNFDLNTLSFVEGGTGGVQTAYGNLAPRFGFAAQLPHGLVLHGGYGMVYYPGDFAAATTLFNLPYQVALLCSPLGGTCPTGTGPLNEGPPLSPRTAPTSEIYDSALGNSLTVVGKQTNYRPAYLEQFNLTLQKQFGANAVTLGYTGSVGRRQDSQGGWQANFPQPDSEGNIPITSWSAGVPTLTRYYASQLPGVGELNYFENEGTSSYNALQLILDRRVAKGLNVNANYTWAHGLNDWSGYQSGGAEGFWRFNYAYDYGNSDYDVKDRLAYTATYDIPFGNTLNGASALLLKGWTLSSSGSWQTGLPLQVVDSDKPGGPFGDVSGSMRAGQVSGVNPYAKNKPLSQWLNPKAFFDPTLVAEQQYAACGTNTVCQNSVVFTMGNERSNQLYGPHIRDFDLAAYKQIPIRGELDAQFRAECFNISNTPSFLPPTNDVNSSSFGLVSGTQFGMYPRVFQFALKVQF